MTELRIPLHGSGQALYVAQEKVYPREISGRFARLRMLSVWLLLGIFYVFPWLEWHGRQAVLFDLPARKFFIFGLVFWPQDFIFLTWLLIIAALSLFFFTAVAGRLWCGYACPQTVWTETFLWMERLVEGDRNARQKLDRGPWNADKLLRKGAKQCLWITFALWTGFTFVGFFSPIRALAGEVLGLSLGGWETFWILFYGFATYGNAGFLREQVCKYMCPYARFQGAMFDRDTLIITYDKQRGEPRGARKRGTDAKSQGLGDCIDCTWCVQVCPTGIDIRQGLQIECIACAACIDACDEIMDKMGSPRGLIRYTTQHALDQEPTRLLRPRVLVYAGLLTALVAGFVTAVALRPPVSLDVIRDRNSLYRLTDDGHVENVYTLRILNKTEHERRFELEVDGEGEFTLLPRDRVYTVKSGEVYSTAVRVRRAAYEPLGPQTIEFELESLDDEHVEVKAGARFLAPTR
ncbi:MAG TPA: cytochrome c oxidase accessory protein CcoG [Steroidobacteraceae bacterium]|nr:cytochrome c oxidase accessory protein CcoG [Steroidobacteraceae bacterium]